MPVNKISHLSCLFLSLSVPLFLSACSQTQNLQDDVVSTQIDALTSSESKDNTVRIEKFEKLNRSIYKMNVGLDQRLLKPVAQAYKRITPDIIDTSVTNIFSNLGDVSNAINNLLQLKVGGALKDTERFLFNSTFGMAGIFDIATEMGLQKHEEDFGQTLAFWGVPSGPYVMLPIFGPSTLRDASSKFTVDLLTDPAHYSEEEIPLMLLNKLDQRADLIATEDILKDLSDDQYSALRDAWLQRRANLIRDGKVDEKEDSDMIDELEDLDAE